MSAKILSLLNYLPYMLSCPTCLVPYVLLYPTCSRVLVRLALHALVYYVFRASRTSCPTCSRALRASCPTCSHALRASCPMCSRATRASWPMCSCASHISCFMCLLTYVALCLAPFKPFFLTYPVVSYVACSMS